MVVIGLLMLLKPKSKRQSHAIGSAADNKEWVLTGRIDFVDPHSAGEHVLQVEERGLLKVRAVWSIGKSDGEGRRSMKSRWFWCLTMPNEIF